MIVPLAATLALPRPEYAKQTEMILVDLLWRSSGSILGQKGCLSNLGKGRNPRQRLVLERLSGNSDAKVVETMPWIEAMPRTGLFATEQAREVFTAAIMGSVTAPSSRRDKSVTCVPVHPSLTPLQTLHGAVNKDQPPDLAKAVEVMAHLGGGRDGDAARLFAGAFAQPDAGLPDAFFRAVGIEAWSRLGLEEPTPWPESLHAPPEAEPVDSGRGALSLGPAGWFWSSWKALLDPQTGWRDALPTRRLVDWAVCLLRTGLAMTYLWEAEFHVRLRRFLVSEPSACEPAWSAVTAMFDAPRLLMVGRQGIPHRERNIQAHVAAVLGEGYRARSAVDEWSKKALRVLDLDADGMTNLSSLPDFPKDQLDDPRTSPKTTREFVRYLLQARVADAAAWDEGDLYYLTRSNRREVWVEPGPEWLVLVASMACGRPGGTCTLGQVRREMARMGLGVERTTLVGLLEGAGLTQDSPDADEAVIVKAGF